LELGRLPLVGAHDTLTFLTASLIVFSIPFTATLKERVRFCQVVSITAALFTVFALFSSKHNTPLPPVLKTLWFEAHVVLAFLSYALFGIAAILGLLYLRKQESLYEGMQYRAMAFLAWGTYWLWTPKELWTSILWIYYSFFLHARLRQWWVGKPLSYCSIIGFAIVLFTYLGVSLLMKSSHSF
jgi:ABC-type transport system involved in cytochrome c biogenesis permease subunit